MNRITVVHNMWLKKCIVILLAVMSVNAIRNIATNKPTRQSDRESSSRAVDGNRYGIWEGGSCILARNGLYTWWCVDLGHIYNLSTIVIYSQTDYENMSGFQLRLSNKEGCNSWGFQSSTTCYRDSGSSKLIYNVNECNQGVATTFAAKTIYISRDRILGFCEVEVFSDSCPSTFCKDGLCNSTTGFCSECLPGRYGNLCEKTCLRCKRCRQADGECDLNCEDGFWGSHCQKDCSSLCLRGVCHPLSGHCKGCRPGRHGNFCEQTCPECQLSCQQSDGSCTRACTLKTWGPLCEHRCSKMCKNGLCDDVTGRCESCAGRYYGDECENTCFSCRSSCDQTSGVCTDGCVEGFWGRDCKNVCPATCNPGGCSRSDGACVNGCRRGWYGPTCDVRCSEYCFRGCRQMDGVCNTCLNGRYGSYCEKPCSNCKPGGCSRSKGVCFGGCISGAWGADCTSKCRETCYGGCLQSTGECLSCSVGTYGSVCKYDCLHCNDDGCRRRQDICNTGCIIGWYGDRCGKKCESGCRGGCRGNDGACNECMEGLYGALCDERCSVGCVNGRCSKQDGSCQCKPGFTGERCQTKLKLIN